MNILVVANHYAVASGRYIVGAFERAGHTVKHIGPAMGRDIWGLKLPPEYVWTPDSTEQLVTDGFTADRVDLVVLADSDPHILDLEWPYTAPVIVWGVDNHVRNYYRPHINHYFLAHRNVSLMAWERPLDMTHLPCGYNPTMCTPSAIPWADRRYDVAILGYMYPQRRAAVKALQEAGLRVIWGCGLVGESYVKAHHDARISLCLSARGDVAIRVFESAAMGCVTMVDDCPDFAIVQPDGVWQTKPEDIVADVREILSQPALAEAAIARAQAWVKAHTFDERVKVIEAWYERTYRNTLEVSDVR